MKRVFTWVKRGITVVWMAFIGFVAVIITKDNPDPTQLTLFSWDINYSTGIIFFIVLIAGVLAGVIPFLISLLLSRQKIKLMQKKMIRLEQELNNTRLMTTKGQA